ncbi:GNAT family N-acetyltransferase [Halarcobacter ebronensis]|uniref:GNAT family N-acetyltransferase n=1 Tax=Halarcobacter ebronensis TaxID=1462615 RepID=A0A4V1M0U5_9BACT|nr:GNAT family N-acetyltransferase [Halarcobacter ebronensis]
MIKKRLITVILKNNLQICNATEEDINSLLPLLKKLFAIEKDFTFDEEKHKEGLKLLLKQRDSVIVLAKFEGEIVAMVTLQTIISTAVGAKTGLIEDFIVNDDYRDMGVGTYLFEYLKEYAHRHHIKRLQLVCDNDNTSAKEFYLKKSFKKSNLSAWYNHLK